MTVEEIIETWRSDIRARRAAIAKRSEAMREEAASLQEEELKLKLAADRAEKSTPPAICPDCWVLNGVVDQLEAIPNPQNVKDEHDLFRCRRCGKTYEIAY